MSRDLSPAEQIVEAAAPRSMREGLPAGADLDSKGEPIRPWQPKGEKALGAPPAVTVEGEDLEFSPGPPTIAQGSPNHKRPLGRYERDFES